jgi:hypothetical protein
VQGADASVANDGCISSRIHCRRTTWRSALPQRGEIVYSVPRNALAMFYADSGEAFAELQPVGLVVSGIDSLHHPAMSLSRGT